MIRGGFRFQQLVAADLAFGIELADALLLLVGEARGHRPGRDQDLRQMPEAQGADEQPRHDLVADAEQGCPVEHAVTEADRRGKRDGVA